MEISIDKAFLEKWPSMRLGVLLLKVETHSSYPVLEELIKTTCSNISASLAIENISQKPAIAAARKGYKAIGKDPARYRLSAEALLRRAVQGKGLYQINNIVDALNLVSLKSGISIGGYDFSKIEGDISLGIGIQNEPYEAIGRGNLNIEFMPVLRDQKGAFGSPTSDSMRTMVTADTKEFLMVFFSFDGTNGLTESMDDAVEVLKEFAEAEILTMTNYPNQ